MMFKIHVLLAALLPPSVGSFSSMPRLQQLVRRHSSCTMSSRNMVANAAPEEQKTKAIVRKVKVQIPMIVFDSIPSHITNALSLIGRTPKAAKSTDKRAGRDHETVGRTQERRGRGARQEVIHSCFLCPFRL
jgi:hypothetical protein